MLKTCILHSASLIHSVQHTRTQQSSALPFRRLKAFNKKRIHLFHSSYRPSNFKPLEPPRTSNLVNNSDLLDPKPVHNRPEPLKQSRTVSRSETNVNNHYIVPKIPSTLRNYDLMIFQTNRSNPTTSLQKKQRRNPQAQGG